MPPTAPAILPAARTRPMRGSAGRRTGNSGGTAQGADPMTPYGRRGIKCAEWPGREGGDRACGWLHSLAEQSRARGAESGARARAATAPGRSGKGDGWCPRTPPGPAARHSGTGRTPSTSWTACLRFSWQGPSGACGSPAAPAAPRGATAGPVGKLRPAAPSSPTAGGGCAWLASLGERAREHTARLQVTSFGLAHSSHLGQTSGGVSESSAGSVASGRMRKAVHGLRPSPYGGDGQLAVPSSPLGPAVPVAGVPICGPSAHGGGGGSAIPFAPLGLVAPMEGVPMDAHSEVCTGAGACPHA